MDFATKREGRRTQEVNVALHEFDVRLQNIKQAWLESASGDDRNRSSIMTIALYIDASSVVRELIEGSMSRWTTKEEVE